MQLLQANRDALLKPLQTVAGIVERRHTMPILANILLRKEGNKIAFVATDLEVQITTHADFGVGDDVDSTTVAARKLLDFVRALPAANDVKLKLQDGKLGIQSGKSRLELQTLNGAEYPTVSVPETWNVSFTIPQKALRKLFGMVHFAMAQQDIRYYLNGTLMVFEPGMVRAVATDGHRLAHAAEEIEGIQSSSEVILPRKTVLEVQRLLDDSDEPVNIDVSSSQIRFRFGDIELISKLVEGKFPDFKRVIPSDYTRHFNVNREALQSSLHIASILMTDKLKGIKLQMENNLLQMKYINADQENAQDEIEIDYSFEPLSVGFNVTYLQDVLSMAKTEEVIWSVKPDVNASALITLPEEKHFKYVVMPMRI